VQPSRAVQAAHYGQPYEIGTRSITRDPSLAITIRLDLVREKDDVFFLNA
jgi:hypothetical protein